MIKSVLVARKKREFTLSEETNHYIDSFPSRTRSRIADEAFELHKQKMLNQNTENDEIEEKPLQVARVVFE